MVYASLKIGDDTCPSRALLRILHIIYYILHIIYYTKYYILYIIYYILYIIYYILCIIYLYIYVIYYMLYLLYFYVIYYMLYIIYYILYLICYILDIIGYILYIIYYMLYIIIFWLNIKYIIWHMFLVCFFFKKTLFSQESNNVSILRLWLYILDNFLRHISFCIKMWLEQIKWNKFILHSNLNLSNPLSSSFYFFVVDLDKKWRPTLLILMNIVTSVTQWLGTNFPKFI